MVRAEREMWRVVARSLCAAVLAGTVFGCGAWRSRADARPLGPGAAAFGIGVLRDGWHTGLVVPVAALGASRARLSGWFPHDRYLVFGWGERHFYMAAHPGMGTELRALFPAASVLLVQGLAKRPDHAHELAQDPQEAHLRWICANPMQAEKLAMYLSHYLKLDGKGKAIALRRGPMPHSRFFASTGTYDAFHTCNTWTVGAMASAGMPVSSTGVLFAAQAMSTLQPLEAASSAACRGGSSAVSAGRQAGSRPHE